MGHYDSALGRVYAFLSTCKKCSRLLLCSSFSISFIQSEVMEENVPGTSDPKKRKITLRNPKKLTDMELEQLLNECSEDEEEYGSDRDYILDEDDDSEEDTGDEGEEDNEMIASITEMPERRSTKEPPIWTSIPPKMNIFEFTKTNALLKPVPGNMEPIDFFRFIFDDEILNLVVSETNHYAEELFCAEGVSENSRITRWKPVTPEEMLTFLGLLLHMGTIKLNRLQDYWKSHPLFNLKCFSTYMSRDRFLVIMRCLHFARNPAAEETTYDRLQKIRPIINFFNNKMTSIYYPAKELSLDESMVLWHGRLIFRQYIKSKCHKYAIKLYMLTEPNGMILQTVVYTAVSGKGDTTKVVLELLQNYLDAGHSVYLDNFYNSVELVEKLTERKTYCSGTLNVKQKDNPKQVLAKKLKRGETAASYSNKILVGKWKDKRDVLYLSNEYTNEMIEYIDKRNRAKTKPAPIYHYKRHTGGVDRQDQMNSYYPCERKSMRWYKKLGIHFLQLMLLNAYTLHKKFSQTLPLYDFRLSILEKLLRIENTKTPRTQKSPIKHLPSKIDKTNDKGETNRKRCRVCSSKNIRKLTIYECQQCPEKPGLCVGVCFEMFHS